MFFGAPASRSDFSFSNLSKTSIMNRFKIIAARRGRVSPVTFLSVLMYFQPFFYSYLKCSKAGCKVTAYIDIDGEVCANPGKAHLHEPDPILKEKRAYRQAMKNAARSQLCGFEKTFNVLSLR